MRVSSVEEARERDVEGRQSECELVFVFYERLQDHQ